MVVVEHVRQDVLCVLQSLCHFIVSAFESFVQRHGHSLVLFIDIGYLSAVRVQQDLRVILETYLNYFIGEAEHDGVLGLHPLFDVDNGLGVRLHTLILHVDVRVVAHLLLVVLQVRPKVLQQRYFLL